MKTIPIQELERLIVQTARYEGDVPSLRETTPLDGGPAGLTLFEMAEVLVRIEERTGASFKTEEVSREWFSTLGNLARQVSVHILTQTQEV